MIEQFLRNGRNVVSAQISEMSVLGVETVFRLKRDALSMFE